MSSSLHPRLRTEVFANNDLCTFCWPHPSSLPAQLAPDTGGRGQGPAGREGRRQRREAYWLSEHPCMGPASAPSSTHPRKGLSREARCLGSPTWPQRAPEGTGLGQVCVSGVGITWLSSWNPRAHPAFLSDLTDELLPHPSNQAVTATLLLALPQGG